MKVTIEGDNVYQIRDGCMTIARAIKAKPRSQSAQYQRDFRMKKRERMKQNREQREVLRRAFALVRNDPARKSIVSDLAKADGCATSAFATGAYHAASASKYRPARRSAILTWLSTGVTDGVGKMKS